MADAKQIVRRLIEEPWKGNMDVIDESHRSPATSATTRLLPEPIRGPDGVKANFQQYIDGFPAAHSSSTTRSRKATRSRRAGRPRDANRRVGRHRPDRQGGHDLGTDDLTPRGGMIVEEWTTGTRSACSFSWEPFPAPAQA